MKMFKYIAIGLIVFILKSCGSSKDATTSMKDDNQNMKKTGLPLGNYNVKSIDNVDTPSSDFMISFDGKTNKVSGFSGCNRFFGAYELDGENISFSGLGSTEMYCKRFMDVEQKMMSMLSEANRFSINNGELTLMKDSNAVLSAKVMETRMSKIQDNMTIEYTAGTRGFYNQIIIQNGMASVKKSHSETAKTRPCTKEELETITTLLNAISAERLPKLEAPSKGHQTDRAAISHLKITQGDQSYQTPSFDHGKPNTYVASLVNTLVGMIGK